MKREKMALQKNIFGQKPGPAKTISDKKKWSGHQTHQIADDGLECPAKHAYMDPIWATGHWIFRSITISAHSNFGL